MYRWLTKFGKVHSVKLGEKKDKWLGYGFVNYYDPESTHKALEFDESKDSS